MMIALSIMKPAARPVARVSMGKISGLKDFLSGWILWVDEANELRLSIAKRVENPSISDKIHKHRPKSQVTENF